MPEITTALVIQHKNYEGHTEIRPNDFDYGGSGPYVLLKHDHDAHTVHVTWMDDAGGCTYTEEEFAEYFHPKYETNLNPPYEITYTLATREETKKYLQDILKGLADHLNEPEIYGEFSPLGLHDAISAALAIYDILER